MLYTRFGSWETSVCRGRRINVSTSTTPPLQSRCRCGRNRTMSTCRLVDEVAGTRRCLCIPLIPGHGETPLTGTPSLLRPCLSQCVARSVKACPVSTQSQKSATVLSQKSETVAVVSPFSATVSLSCDSLFLCDSVDRA